MERERTHDIRQFILNRIDARSSDVARAAAREYGISRQAVNRHFHALIEEGVLEATGKTRAREYRLLPTRECTRRLTITPALTEDRMWEEYIRPLVDDVPHHVRDICHYGFTEVANNALQHSGAARVSISARRTATAIDMAVTDNGAGIFNVLLETFGFTSPREAIFELSKSRLTTAPETHTGGSLFLVSRMFDRLEIQSSDHTFAFDSNLEMWSVVREAFAIHGTSVRMHTSLTGARTLAEVADTWKTRRGELGRAHIPVALLASEGEALVSRSQGQRLCRRLGQCSEALLDFRGVERIGRGFADEVFRVFRTARPQTALVTLHANASVRASIREALESGEPTRSVVPSAAMTGTSRDERPAVPPPPRTPKNERPPRR